MRLAEWTRSAEAPLEEASPFTFGATLKLLLPDIIETMPPFATLARIVEYASGSPSPEDFAFAVETLVTAARQGWFDNDEEKLVTHVLGIISTPHCMNVEQVQRWAQRIAEGLGSTAAIQRLLRDLPPAIRELPDLNAAELALKLIHCNDDPAKAREEALVLLEREVPAAQAPDLRIAPGSEEHRRALLRLHLLQEVALRSLELDDVDPGTVRVIEAFKEAIAWDPPGIAAEPKHDLAGFDLAAQIASRDWRYAEVVRDTRVGWEAFLEPVQIMTAQRALSRSAHGRYLTECDAVVTLTNQAVDQAFREKTDNAEQSAAGAFRIANLIRCFSLRRFVQERRARIKLRQAELADSPSKAQHLDAASAYGIDAGAREVVERAAQERRKIGSQVAASVANDTPKRRDQRVCRLARIKELAPLASDTAIRALAELTRDEMLAGPFSMNSMLDVQRTAVAASAALLDEAAGLEKTEDFQATAGLLLASWEELLRADLGKGKMLVSNEVSDAVGHVLKLPASRFSEDIVERVLTFADGVSKDRRFIDGDAWVNFIRPAVALIVMRKEKTERLEEIRQKARHQLPDFLAPTERMAALKGADVPMHPEDRYNLLALVYACQLGATPHDAVHHAVELFTVYCAHFRDGSKRAGLQHPLRPDLALRLAEYAPPEMAKALRRELVGMATSSMLSLETRHEVLVALYRWIELDGATAQERVGDLLEHAPNLFENVLAELTAMLAAGATGEQTGKENDGFPFSRVNLETIAGALIVFAFGIADHAAGWDELNKEADPRLVRLADLVEGASAASATHIRGTARNIAAALVVDPRVDAPRRERLGALFISSLYQPEDDVAAAAIAGLHHTLKRRTPANLPEVLRRILCSPLGERARSGSPKVQLKARLALQAIRDRPEIDAATRSQASTLLEGLQLGDGEHRALRRAEQM